MPFDFDDCADSSPPRVDVPPMAADDLEHLVILLELGAITLTRSADSTFTTDQLLVEAKKFADQLAQPEDGDLRLVLQTCKFLERDGELLRLR